MKELDEPIIDANRNVDDMPDCLLKYQTIVAQAKEQKRQFIDAEFPHDNTSLGDDLVAEIFPEGARWVSFSEKGGLPVEYNAERESKKRFDSNELDNPKQSADRANTKSSE